VEEDVDLLKTAKAEVDREAEEDVDRLRKVVADAAARSIDPDLTAPRLQEMWQAENTGIS
jgi:hypothetical protein